MTDGDLERWADPRQWVSLPVEISGNIDLQLILDVLEKKILQATLDKTGGRKKDAADLLNITFRSIRYRLKKYGLD